LILSRHYEVFDSYEISISPMAITHFLFAYIFAFLYISGLPILDWSLGYSIKHYVIKFVSDFPKFGGLQNALQQKCTAIMNIFNIIDIKCKCNIFDLTLPVVNYCRNLINLHCYVKPILSFTLVQNKLISRSLPL
jgi:uncharacterized membrane protein